MSADRYEDCPKCGKEDSLREDYEFYSGKYDPDSDKTYIHADYNCSCECGFTFAFAHKEKMKGLE